MKTKSTYQLKKGDVVTINDTSEWCGVSLSTLDFSPMKKAEHVVTLRILSNAKFDKGLDRKVCSVFRYEVLDITTTGDVYGKGTSGSTWERSRSRNSYESVSYKKDGRTNWQDPRNKERGWTRVDSHQQFTVVEG